MNKNIVALFFTPLIFVVLFLVSTTYSFAVEVKKGDVVDVSANEAVNESLVITGQSLTIESNIDGDLFCAGQNVIVKGNVNGDILCLAQDLKVQGSVSGSVRAVAQDVEIFQQVTRNLTVFAQRLILYNTSAVEGESFFGVQQAEISGLLGKKVSGWAQDLFFNGSANQDIEVRAQTVRVGDKARILGNFSYESEKEAEISDQTKIAGKVTWSKPFAETDQQPTKFVPTNRLQGTSRLASFLLSLGFGLVLLYFLSGKIRTGQEKMIQNPLGTFFLGVLVILVVPIAIVFSILTIIGIPFAIFVILLFLLCLFAGRIYVFCFLGKKLLEQFAREKSESLAWSLVLGSVLYYLLTWIPVLGFLISFFTLPWGLGGFLSSLKTNYVSKTVKKK